MKSGTRHSLFHVPLTPLVRTDNLQRDERAATDNLPRARFAPEQGWPSCAFRSCDCRPRDISSLDVEYRHGRNASDCAGKNRHRYVPRHGHRRSVSVHGVVQGSRRPSVGQAASRLCGQGVALAARSRRVLERIEELDAGAPTRCTALRVRQRRACFTSSNSPPRTWPRLCSRGRDRHGTVADRSRDVSQAGAAGSLHVEFLPRLARRHAVAVRLCRVGLGANDARVFDLRLRRDLARHASIGWKRNTRLPYWLPDGKSFVYSRRRKLAADAPPTEGYKFTQAFRHTTGRRRRTTTLVFGHGAPGSPPWERWIFPR